MIVGVLLLIWFILFVVLQHYNCKDPFQMIDLLLHLYIIYNKNVKSKIFSLEVFYFILRPLKIH